MLESVNMLRKILDTRWSQLHTAESQPELHAYSPNLQQEAFFVSRGITLEPVRKLRALTYTDFVREKL